MIPSTSRLVPTRSLRVRLSISFAALAVLGATVIGLVLLPILASHYATAERTYLEAAVERAVRDLSGVTWRDRSALAAVVGDLALVTQARVTVTDDKGAVVVDVPAPTTAPAVPTTQPLPNPLGATLIGAPADPATLPRSAQSVSRPVNGGGKAGARLLGTVLISDAPAYEQVALGAVMQAWLVASLLGVVVSALAGLGVAAWLTRPLRALTVAADRMAAEDLTARTGVTRDDEIGRLARSFDAVAERTEETIGSLRRFVADAAHEIGTPLTALRADLDLADASATTGDERRLVRRAIAQSQRLESLAAGLLRLSRLETHDGRAVLERVDLVALVRGLADAAASRAEQAEIELRLHLPTEPVTVQAEPDRLQSAIANLVDNALKFTPAGGSVDVAVAVVDGIARLSVVDTGIGIPPADMPGLFERFHRARNASGYEGNGLGLAIVRATAERYGGSVTASSGPDGSRFELVLPLR